MAPQQRYANAKTPDFVPLIEGTKYEKFDSAAKRLASIRKRYTVSKDNDPLEKSSLKLWLFNYAVTPEEKKEGFLGNYAIIRIKQLENGKCTLKMKKEPTDLRYHPRRKTEKKRLPNWGHPILRAVKKNRKYNSEKEAGKELKLLMEEYPETAIPMHNGLYLMVFDRTTPPSGGKKKNTCVRKIILNIESVDDHFIIRYMDNPRAGRIPRFKIHEMYDSNFLYHR